MLILKVSLMLSVLGMLAACTQSMMPEKVSETRQPITDFGAVPDGTTLNTVAIQKGIDTLAAAGGGTLVVPKGRFLSGALYLKAGVNLHVEKEGVLLGSTNIADFPMTRTRIEGHFQEWVPALINADHHDHLRITGEGMLDGQGAPYHLAFRTTIAANRATKNLDVPRPRLILIQNSNDVQVTGLRLKDAGFWNLHIYRCTNVLVDDLDIRAPRGSPSTDGVDVDSCQHVTISRTTIFNNDDCIALKGTKGPLAMQDKDSPPVEHIFIKNCTFEAGGGITCGSEATIVRDVRVEDCTFKGTTSNIIRLKLRADTPQLYEDIHFNNITCDGVGKFFSIEPWRQYFDLMGQAPPKRTVRNVSLTNVKGTFGSFGNIRPAEGDTIESITVENIDVKMTAIPARPAGSPATQPTTLPGSSISGIGKFTIKNVKFNGEPFVESH